MATTRRITANARAIGGSAKFFAYAIISLVVIYSDVMFVSLMWNSFPGGFLTIAAIGGAFATGISVIALVIGKSHWFRPGGQLVWAWCFTAIEILVSVMNVVLSVMVARGEPLGYLSIYLMIAPATPVVALVGWVLILYMDKERAQLHEEMEMEDDLASAEREHQRQVHATRMDLKATALSQQREYLKQHLASAEVQAVLSEGSYQIAAGIVSEIIQRPIMPRPTIVEGSVAKSIDTPRVQAPKSIDTPEPRAEKISKVTVQPPFSQPAKKPLPRQHHARYIVNKHPKERMAPVVLAKEEDAPDADLLTKSMRSRGSRGKKGGAVPGAIPEK